MELDVRKTLNGRGEPFRLEARLGLPCRRLVLFGPSGSGKSLTLMAVAGLLKPDAGRIAVNGRVLFDAENKVDEPTQRRRVGFLFQDYALFPHLSLRHNVEFGLSRLWRRLSAEGRRRVDELLDLFGLSALAKHLPGELSGGQRQRAALARALAPSPELLLLDEPFSALDQPLRFKLREELKKTLERFNTPLILVTHDPGEALEFGDAVAVFTRGRVRRVITGDELAACPDPQALLAEAYGSDAAA